MPHRSIATAQHDAGQTNHLHSRVGSRAPVDWQYGLVSKAPRKESHCISGPLYEMRPAHCFNLSSQKPPCQRPPVTYP